MRNLIRLLIELLVSTNSTDTSIVSIYHITTIEGMQRNNKAGLVCSIHHCSTQTVIRVLICVLLGELLLVLHLRRIQKGGNRNL